jgi:hypothetical protein
MVYFQNKNHTLGKFWKVLQRKIMGIWSILLLFGYFVAIMVVWYIFHRFGMLYQEKSGNPVANGVLKMSSYITTVVSLQCFAKSSEKSAAQLF